MSEKKIPQISVIIPMYNTEEYVGECLHSLLVQTFQDFEVIVVDDCSTDDSVNVVKGYRPKFKGKLRIIESEENFGGPAVPRNIGMKHATGKYIFFLDSDDLIVKNALEKLYSIAKEYDADVVQCDLFFASDTSELKGAKLNVRSFNREKLSRTPTLETDDIKQRIMEFHSSRYFVTAWSKLLRRDFLVKYKIENPVTKYNEDYIFTIFCLSCAKRWVRIPQPLNIYRYRSESIVHSKGKWIDHIRKWVHALVTGFSSCDKFLSGLEYYKQNPDVKYLALDAVAQNVFGKLIRIYKKISPAILDQIIREEFEKSDCAPALAAFFFNMSIMYSLQIGTYLLNKDK